MRKSPLLCLLSLLLLLFFSQNPLSAHARIPKNKKTRQLEEFNDGGKIVCIDLADFYYEIILSVTSFPEQGDCNQQEDSEIAALLQKTINKELRAIPGTIKTQNKVCADPINDRRLLTAKERSFSFEILGSNTTHFVNKFMVSSQYATAEENDKRNLLRHGARSFIYIGGGRCRYCFYDNYDSRALFATATDRLFTHGESLVFENTKKKNDHHRNLLSFSTVKSSYNFPKVADISLCKRSSSKIFTFEIRQENKSQHKYQNAIKWINEKHTKVLVKTFDRGEKSASKFGKALFKHMFSNTRSEEPAEIFDTTGAFRWYYWHLAGPYVPGESLGVQFDANGALRSASRRYREEYEKEFEMAEAPVKQGTVRFRLYAFDLPTDFSTGMLTDDLIVFLNGIKLDFKLLMSEPGTKSSNLNEGKYIRGSSFAGIRWVIHSQPGTRLPDNFAFGPEADREYLIAITAPVVVFDHKNQLDIDFMIKPDAKAKQYAIGDLGVFFNTAECEVTGMENSPFQDFQSVVESRLFHKLGLDLANAFQGKQGHCLYDKIPVVKVNLVEKETLRESKPQCGK